MAKLLFRRLFLLTVGVLLIASCTDMATKALDKTRWLLGGDRQRSEPEPPIRMNFSEGQTITFSSHGQQNVPIGFCGVVEQVTATETKVKFTEVWQGGGSLGFMVRKQDTDCFTEDVTINQRMIGRTIWIRRTCDLVVGPGCSRPYRQTDPYRR